MMREDRRETGQHEGGGVRNSARGGRRCDWGEGLVGGEGDFEGEVIIFHGRNPNPCFSIYFYDLP